MHLLLLAPILLLVGIAYAHNEVDFELDNNCIPKVNGTYNATCTDDHLWYLGELEKQAHRLHHAGETVIHSWGVALNEKRHVEQQLKICQDNYIALQNSTCTIPETEAVSRIQANYQACVDALTPNQRTEKGLRLEIWIEKQWSQKLEAQLNDTKEQLANMTALYKKSTILNAEVGQLQLKIQNLTSENKELIKEIRQLRVQIHQD